MIKRTINTIAAIGYIAAITTVPVAAVGTMFNPAMFALAILAIPTAYAFLAIEELTD